MNTRGKTWFPILSLFASTGTLFCCALPALLVTLGAGAAVASATSAFPFLVLLSEKKGWVFIGSALMLGIAGYLQWKTRNAPCPLEPSLARACEQGRKWSRGLYFASCFIFFVGAAFAFLLPALSEFLDSAP